LIDILIAAVLLPSMGGRELAEALGKQYPKMSTLFLSDYTEDITMRHGVPDRRGASPNASGPSYLVKTSRTNASRPAKGLQQLCGNPMPCVQVVGAVERDMDLVGGGLPDKHLQRQVQTGLRHGHHDGGATTRIANQQEVHRRLIQADGASLRLLVDVCEDLDGPSRKGVFQLPQRLGYPPEAAVDNDTARMFMIGKHSFPSTGDFRHTHHANG